jgi:diacylglycerol kinase family enzyme
VDNDKAPAAGHWLARYAILAALASACVLLVGGRHSVALVVSAAAAVVAVLVGGWLFLAHRGVVRWCGAVLALGAPVAVLALYIAHSLLWIAILVAALLVSSVVAAREAVRRLQPTARTALATVSPPSHPVVIMNPRSGGGKVARFALDQKAKALGAEVILLDGEHHVDVADLARRGISDGADLLGVAGGDGTQALVAGICASHDVSFLVISAGTRNHFAMDLGLDREHPDACLTALEDGVELCVDLGDINGRPFVNNASFGAYAAVVQSPAYRNDKRGTTLRMLPDALSGHRGPRLSVRIDDATTIEAPQALLISNNPYELSDFVGLGRRPRLDGGVLGVIAVTVNSAAQAAALVRGGGHGVRQMVAREVVVDADADEIAVGIDGEALMIPVPVRCTIRPRVLRVVVPRERPDEYRSAGRVEVRTVFRAAAGR